MNKKTEFLLRHRKLYDLYAIFGTVKYKMHRIGKSEGCLICQNCIKQGCLKNKIAKRFKLAGTLEAKCFKLRKNEVSK